MLKSEMILDDPFPLVLVRLGALNDFPLYIKLKWDRYLTFLATNVRVNIYLVPNPEI